MSNRKCAYCGEPATTSDHVFPRGLYGDGVIGEAQLITVPSCARCNNGRSEADTEFRNVMAIAGEPNRAVNDLWSGKIRRGFAATDGRKRAKELVSHMRPAEALPSRYMVYPAEIPSVICTVRKIVRGLCHHHGLLTAMPDEQVWADVCRFSVPQEFLDAMPLITVNPSVVEYRYTLLPEEVGIHSAWLIALYGRTPFICVVYDSVDVMRSAQMDAAHAA